jgi:glutamate dehydrogenase (NAD(P)+)
MERLNRPLQDATVAIQGFGNVGSYAAKFLERQNLKIVAVSDALGGIRNEKGLAIDALLDYSRTHRTVKGFPESQQITNEELLTSPVDVLIPAALGNVLTPEIAKEVQAKLIVEAANNPTTPDADAILEKRDILVVPDVLANAGGVTVSYFEWVQNRQHFKWELARVRKELDKIMQDSLDKVWTIATDKKVTLRTAAYLLGIGRVGRATILGGI